MPSVPQDGQSATDAAEPLFFNPTPGPGDSDGGDVYPPEEMSDAGSLAFLFGGTAARLEPGGYEVVYETESLEVGIYVLAAPEPDEQSPHEWDELYFVLEGRGTLTAEGVDLQLEEGGAAFVPAHAEHRFGDYERIVLLVVFDKH
jgi:mannose-6-phosphate isomerase-like protein (cupin superfamily)